MIAEPLPPSDSPRSAERPWPRRPVLRMSGVSKTFSNGTLALRDMLLTVQPGEFVSLLGPSGCGKSTALRIVAGLGAVSSGSVEWPAFTVNAKGLPERDVSFVFQDPTLMPWRTVFARAYPRELSGGMRMRVSIARAMVTQPKLLLMDEPFAALDEITRQKLNDDVLALWQRTGVTVIFVTHSVIESAYLSSRIVVMRARPGQVDSDFRLLTSQSRDAHYRTSEEFRQACETVSHALAKAMTAGEAH